MPDVYDAATRSRVMRQVKSKDTKPELLLRRTLWGFGVRGYRLHRKDIAGKPDIAFVGQRVAVFVDGAWWHGHPDKWWKGRSGDYWDRKVSRNMERDRQADQVLAARGWTVIRVWDFEVMRDPEAAARRVIQALPSHTRLEVESADSCRLSQRAP